MKSKREKGATESRPDSLASAISLAIAKEDARYVSPSAATESIESSKSLLTRYSVRDPVVSEFYKVAIEFEHSLSSLPGIKSVAKFAKEQGWTRRFFVNLPMEEYEVEVPPDILATMFYAKLKRGKDNYETETRTRPRTLEATEALPFDTVGISYASASPSLSAFQSYIGIIHSLTEVMIVSTTTRLTQKGWTKRELDSSTFQWRFEAYPWTQIVKSPEMIWLDSVDRAESEIKTYLESLVRKDESAADDRDGQSASK
jgi:hypothetical protein